MQRVSVTVIRNLAMTVTLSERSAVKVVVDEPTGRTGPTVKPPSRGGIDGADLRRCTARGPTLVAFAARHSKFTSCSFRVGF